MLGPIGQCEICGVKLAQCSACDGTGERVEPNANLSGMELARCTICSGYGTLEHDHSADALYQREGARGIYLAQTFVEDASELLGIPLPDGFEEYRIKGLDEQETGKENAEEEQWAVEELEGKLTDSHYLYVWEDGYVIYDTNGPSFAAYRDEE